jgi:hypothetical protein
VDRRSPFGLVIVALVAVVAAGLVASIVGGGGSSRAAPRVPFSAVRSLLASTCSGCHPGVVASLDLTPDNAYRSIVGVRSVETPSLPLVLAGDPGRSYLYIKVAGWPGNGRNPIVGGRMPFGQPPLAARDLATLRDWIAEGAPGDDGRTVSAGEVATPGNVAALAAASAPQVTSGDATIAGTITDARHRPLAGAIVTLLVVRPDLPGGEEHYLAAVTDAAGRYAIHGAPVGRVEIKAYAPGTIYVSHLLTTTAGATTPADVGLPAEASRTPRVAGARVTRRGSQLDLAMDVQGQGLDRNYTLAVNPASGRVFELRADPAGSETPGAWSRTVPATGLSGRWLFVAIDHLCEVSNMLEVAGPA